MISSDKVWRCKADEAVRISFQEAWNPALGPSFIATNERVDGSRADLGWLDAEFDDCTWICAIKFSMKAPMLPIMEPRRLVERSIPHFPEVLMQFKSTIERGKTSEDEAQQWNRLLFHDQPRLIDANSRVIVTFDSAALTTGSLHLRFRGGAAGKIRVRCAECFEEPPDTQSADPFSRRKKNRSDHSGDLIGPDDYYNINPEGPSDMEMIYEPFWFRTFRYVELEIETSTAPIEILSFNFRTFHYPLQIETYFSKFPSQEMSKIWDISLNTLKNCMHETYEDCPFYEQNQFAMDARLQIFFTYQISHDDLLARKCMQEFYSSRRADGLIETHFPAPFPVVNIPYFSLYWILIIYDHMMYVGDEHLVRKYLGTVDGILDHFHQRINSDGLVGRFEWDVWPFVDWTKEWSSAANGDFRNLAVPPAYRRSGVLTYSSLIYAYALQRAASLCDFLSRHDTAAEYRERASQLNQAVIQHCFRGKFLVDAPDSPVEERSQHAQVFAVLSGALTGDSAQEILLRALYDPSFARCSYAMSFYVFEACKMTGLYDRLHDSLLQPWREMIDMNLTTWAESEAMPRSDCHGWSAVPIHDFVANVVGITPAAPGYETIRFEPRRKHWQTLSGTFAVRMGQLHISWAVGDAVELTSTFDAKIEVCDANGTTRVYEVPRNSKIILDID